MGGNEDRFRENQLIYRVIINVIMKCILKLNTKHIHTLPTPNTQHLENQTSTHKHTNKQTLYICLKEEKYIVQCPNHV